MALTTDRYLELKGAVCPVCGSADFRGDEVVIDAGTAYQQVSCNECYAVWADMYNLAGYELIEEGT